MKHIKFDTPYEKPVALALGFFDCMHRGHRRILEVARQKAAELGAESALLTFENNYFPLVGRQDKLVYTFEERKTILEKLSLDVLVSARFDAGFMRMSSDEFLLKLAGFNLKSVVCGFDYRFGSDKADAYRMQAFCEKRGIDFHVQQAVVHDGIKISTTLVREALEKGRVDLANFYLADRYFISGVVRTGRRVGHLIGFPTANIAVSPEKLLPPGVFGGVCDIDGSQYKTLINIGGQPTFGSEQTAVEAHILGYQGDLYGKLLTVYLDKFLRPIQKFESEAQLAAQINKDIKNL